MLVAGSVAAVGLALTASPALAGFNQAPGSPISIGGSHAYSVATGNLNGDANLDLAVASDSSNEVTILLGDGSGAYSEPAGSPITTPNVTNATSVAIGNLNGDANADLAVSNYGSNTISILLGDGSGAFSAAAGSPVATGGVGAESVKIGNLNGDANADLAVANLASSNVSILLGNGSGGFTAAAGSPVATGGTNPTSVAIGNLNGDPSSDLAVSNANSNNISILLGNGSGGFSAAAGSPRPASGSGDAVNLQSIAIGDLDGDADADLVTANRQTDNYSILLGDGSGGFLQSPASDGFTGGTDPTSVAIGDLDGDAKPDLAFANEGTDNVSVLLNSGTGSFSPAVGSPFGTFGDGPRFVVIGDLNGDPSADLVAVNSISNDVSILLNAAAVASAGPGSLAFGSQAQGTLSPPQTVTITNTTVGGDDLMVSRVRTVGTHPSDFLVSRDTCTGESIDEEDTCEVDVRFAPSAIGGRSATLEIRHPAGLETVSLSATGGALPQGPAGPQGNQGLQGPAGPQGPQGPPGRDATVTCKAKGKKRIKCSVAFTASRSSKRASARLSRNGVTYARGSTYVNANRTMVPLIAVRPIPAGRYGLTVKVRSRNGGTTVTKRMVTVG
jgi:hypothetical protein